MKRPGRLRSWQIDDAQARMLKRSMAHDVCVCGHYRVEHESRGGCRRCRRCSNYARAAS